MFASPPTWTMYCTNWMLLTYSSSYWSGSIKITMQSKSDCSWSSKLVITCVVLAVFCSFNFFYSKIPSW